jgi:hypothetical protein
VTWDARYVSDYVYHRRRLVIRLVGTAIGLAVIALGVFVMATKQAASTRDVIEFVCWTAFTIWFGFLARKEWREMKANG